MNTNKRRLSNVDRVNFFTVFLLLFISTKTSALSRNIPFMLISFAIVTFIYFFYRRMRLTNVYYKFILFYIALTLFYIAQFQTINPIFTVRIFLVVTMVYFIISMVDEKLYIYFERIVSFLAKISLVLFPIQLIYPREMYRVLTFPVRYLPFMDFAGIGDANIFVYTMKGNALLRNSGFMWEPGAFGAMLLIAILINITINKMKFNWSLFWMIVALVTTFSTTAYIGLSVIMFYYIRNMKSKSLYVIIVPVALIIITMLSQLDFIGQKISNELNTYEYTIDRGFSSTHEEMVSLGRMGSFKIDFLDFLKYPIIGVGGQQESRTWSMTTTLNKTNGFSEYLVTFGIVGMLLLFINYNAAFKRFIKKYNYKGETILLMVILVLSFSNSILTTPLLFAFQLYALFENKYIYISNLEYGIYRNRLE